MSGHVVAGLLAGGDGLLQFADHVVLQRQVGLQHVGHGLAHVIGWRLSTWATPPRNTMRWMIARACCARARLVEGFPGQPAVAHVGIQLAVDQVLIDGGELARQQLVEDGDDARISVHGSSLRGPKRQGSHLSARESRTPGFNRKRIAIIPSINWINHEVF